MTSQAFRHYSSPLARNAQRGDTVTRDDRRWRVVRVHDRVATLKAERLEGCETTLPVRYLPVRSR